MTNLRRFRGDLFALLFLFVLALLWFAPVLWPGVTHATLLPYDNLSSFEPWRSLHPGLVPHNNLLSDLVLENAVWKLHIRRTLAEWQLPLWNPQIFTGIPFLAAGQASVFYPLSVLFYLLPLEAAYGWFTALQIGLAGANLYIFARVLRLQPIAAFLSAIVFMFSGFLIVSVVFTMFLAGVVWLPLLLALIEIIIRKQEEKGIASFHPIPYIAAGIGVICLIMLAGHPELIYYSALVAGAYTLARLVRARRTIAATDQIQNRAQRAPAKIQNQITVRLLKLTAWLLTLAVLGVAAGGVQLLPLLELAPLNFREGSVSLQQVLDWAWPTRHVAAFFLPNIFGNPSHHAWFDLWSWQWTPATVNALGEPINNIFWGIKNYVEGGNYLGIGTWLLASIAILDLRFWILDFKARSTGAAIQNPKFKIQNFYVFFFAGLALVSLLFAFGTRLYAILFYGLPGWNQLHSPFRWVFPFTLSMALLAGFGLERLLETERPRDRETERQGDKETRKQIGRETERLRDWVTKKMGDWWGALPTLVAGGAVLAGVGAIGVVGASFFLPELFIGLGQRFVDGSDLAQMAFADGRMFWSYQAMNLAAFGLFAFVSGLLVWQLTRQRDKMTRWQDGKMTTSQSSGHPIIRSSGHLIILSLLAVILLDLYTAHGRFNPASDPALSPLNPANIPAAVAFLNTREGMTENPNSKIQNQNSPWRFTTFNPQGEKTFDANVGMYYGWQDIRGYDSIIPRQYVQLMNRIAPQENALLYNRIAPLLGDAGGNIYGVLDHPLLDLLNVKYVLTEHYIPNPGWREIYRDNAVGIYENLEVLPRAFIVNEVRIAPADQQPLLETDLRNTLFIEETPPDKNALVPASPQLREARISRYTANDVFVDVNLSDRGWLLLTDAWFPGWKAYLRPFGGDESQETALTLYRANGAFRAVYLPKDGQWTVRFVYAPMSFILGLYTSFLAFIATLLLCGYWAWNRYYRPADNEGEVRTVAKNSLAPMALNLVNKAIDFAFAALYVRLLGPDGTGQYAFVVAVYGIFEILSRYGLGMLLTRDVSADKNQSSRYLTNVVALRTLLWLLSLPLLGLVIWLYGAPGSLPGASWFATELTPIGAQEVQALVIFAFAMLFSNWADALSSMFMAFEKMEYPAGLANGAALLKVTLGALVLLLGWGYVGLAGVSLFINVVQTLWLYRLLRSTLFRPQWQWDWPLQSWMARTSGPLMINHLLATIFWRIDVWLLRPLAGAASVGLYSVGLKYLDGLNIIPSLFSMAIFPLMSRYARNEDKTLLRSYILSLRLLVLIALPIAMATTFLAQDLAYLIGGAEYLNVHETFRLGAWELPYLGGSALALQVIIWSIPIGFVNSITQYVLIAVHQQRYLTKAFILGVLFNIIGNLLVIPGFGYIGAAVVTILSEFSLLFPFYYSIKRHVGVVPWLSIFAAPTVSVAVMGALIYLLTLSGINVWIGVFVGGLVYLFILLVMGAFNQEDMAVVGKALPLDGLLRRLPTRASAVKMDKG